MWAAALLLPTPALATGEVAVETAFLPIASPEDGPAACLLQGYGSPCFVPSQDGGVFVFTEDLVHIAPDGTATQVSGEPYYYVSAAGDGTMWALRAYNWVCECEYRFLVHLDAGGQELVRYGWSDIISDPSWFMTASVVATPAGAWVRDGATLVFVGTDGSISPNVFPDPGDGLQVNMSPFGSVYGLDDGSAMLLWSAKRRSQARYRSRLTTISSLGDVLEERRLPPGYYGGFTVDGAGLPVLGASGPAIVQMLADGTFVRHDIPSGENIIRSAPGRPIVLADGDIYVGLSRFQEMRSGGHELIGHEVWGLVDGDLKRVFADVPGEGQGSVLAPLASSGDRLGIVAGLQGGSSRGIRTTVVLVEAGQIVASKTVRKMPGTPGFDAEGTLWWFPDGSVEGTIIQPVFHVLETP